MGLKFKLSLEFEKDDTKRWYQDREFDFNRYFPPIQSSRATYGLSGRPVRPAETQEELASLYQQYLEAARVDLSESRHITGYQTQWVDSSTVSPITTISGAMSDGVHPIYSTHYDRPRTDHVSGIAAIIDEMIANPCAEILLDNNTEEDV